MATKKTTTSRASATAPLAEQVLREFPPMGKYRIRIVKNGKRQDAKPVLDIREYVSAESFEGFTRRGIRITDRAQLEILNDVLREVLDAGVVAGTVGLGF